MSISVKDLTKIYGEERAVDSINFSIDKGEVVGLLGPNGAGKSTTMKMVTSFIAPSSGDAWVSGLSIYEENLEIRKRIGYLPENNPLYLDMYVKEFLSFSGSMYGVKNLKSKVNELIDLVGLDREKKKKIGALSKGYRQRVGLAQALIHEPEVLILDEPTSGLDPNQIVEIRDLIRQMGKEKTVILSSHIMQEIQAICDRVIIINKGKIVADASTEELLSKNTDSLKVFVSFKNDISTDKLSSQFGNDNVHFEGDNSYTILGSDDSFTEKVFHFAVRENNPILEMKSEQQNLEEVFRQLTNN